MDDRIFHPLQLSTGSHTAGSGRGCAMNVISWENGDKTITDYPECSDPVLASTVQALNDLLGIVNGKRLYDGLGYALTPEDSELVLDIAHQTVGTSYHHLSEDALRRVYVQLAFEAVEKYPKHIKGMKKRRMARKFMARVKFFIESGIPQRIEHDEIPWTLVHYNLASMVDPGLQVPDLYTFLPHATRVSSQAAAILTDLRSMDADVRREQTVFVVQRFKELAGVESPEPDDEKTEEAIERMLVCTR